MSHRLTGVDSRTESKNSEDNVSQEQQQLQAGRERRDSVTTGIDLLNNTLTTLRRNFPVVSTCGGLPAVASSFVSAQSEQHKFPGPMRMTHGLIPFLFLESM